MPTPSGSAARNAMNSWERQCYDWGWEDSEKRIIKILEDLAYTDEDGDEMIGEFKADLIARIQAEND